MKDLIKLRTTLCNELSEYGRMDNISMGNLDVIDKLSHSIKNLDKVIEAESGYSGSYGMIGRYPHMSYNDDMEGQGYSQGYMPYSYDGRGRGSNAERDSMGRYSSRGYSRGDMMSEMRGLVDRSDGRSRQGYERFMGQMENM